MIDLLTARLGMAPVEAYILCSVCCDLRISEIVDQPNWVVGFYFPASSPRMTRCPAAAQPLMA